MLTYEFHYYYIKNKYDNKSRLLFTETDTLMHQIKAEDVYDYEDFSNDKNFFDFSICPAKSKYENLDALLAGKMTDKTSGLSIKECAALKPKICLFLVDDSIEHKKAKGVTKNGVAKTGHKGKIIFC